MMRTTFTGTFLFGTLAAGIAAAQGSAPPNPAPAEAVEPQPATAAPSAADTPAARTAGQVGHNWTVDLNASYVLRNPIGRTVLMAGMNNVFNQSPQYVYAAPLANSDPTVYDYVGRFVYARVQHTF